MVWETLVGHADQVAMFRNSIARGRLGHTYLFVGPGGVGKKTFARLLAQCLLCETYPEESLEACGTCPGCKQVQALTHPDFFIVGCPEGKRELPVEVFLGPPERRGRAGLCYDLSHTPMAGRRKLAVIDDAELLNEASANALLKTLEEPPPHSVLILLATDTDTILPTIRSRCQILRFNPLSPREVADLLIRTGQVENEQRAVEAAALSEGSLSLAVELLEPALLEQRKLLYDGLAAATFKSSDLAAKVLAALDDLGADTAGQRHYAGWLIKFCVEFYRAALWGLTGNQAEFSESVPEAGRFRGRFDPDSPEHFETVARLLERSLEAETHLDQNIGVNLCLETLFDDLGRILRSHVPA